MNSVRVIRSPRASRLAAFAVLIDALLFAAAPVAAQPAFSKSFNPATIGPGSASDLVFTIDNSAGGLVTDLAFVDVLPAGVTLTSPAVPTTNCPSATLSAPDGGGTFNFTDGEVAPGATCTASVLVTSSTPGIYTNTSGDLTSSAGNSGPASADLTVDSALPGFSKSFSPSSGSLGSRSTLTFTIDNTLNSSRVGNLDFTDNLPPGIVVSNPANASTDCVAAMNPNTTLTAVPGTSVVILDANGVNFLPDFEVLSDGATCTVRVDVVSEGLGFLDNVSGDLQADFTPVGRAVGTLESTVTDIALVKEFLADPVPPGGTVDLQFTILNRTRSDDATGVSFTDDLDATLTGLVATGLPAAACGGTVSGTSILTLTGGTVAAASDCSFTVTLQIPPGATPGIYPNTTSAVEADFGAGEPTFGNQASDDLFVFAAPLLEKVFLDDPVAAGTTTRMEFTITNTSATATATDIDFTDDLVAFLGTDPAVSNLPAAGFCGGSSTISYFAGTGILNIAGASLAALDSCTFEVTVEIPVGITGGIYTNVTSAVSATVGPDELAGASASADLEVVAAPLLTKAFTDDPVQPGDTVSLQFTLTHAAEETSGATGIAFTDDLEATLAGLVAIDLPLTDICGTGSLLEGDPDASNLSFTGGSLSPGESCTFPVTLQVPASAELGSFTNTTSEVGATVAGIATTGPSASDALIITEFSFAKTFIDSPVIAGDTATLRFTVENNSPTFALTDIGFTDNLDAMLAGAAAVGLPANDICGTGSSIGGTSTLVFTGGNLAAGESCTFDVTVQIPAGTPDNQFGNTTSPLSATFDGNPVTVAAASAGLEVNSNLLLLSKSFTNDPVVPGGNVTLEFTITNTSSTETVTGIAFTDDLDAALAGMAATAVPADGFCGTGAQATGGGLLTITGANLTPSASCTFQVTVLVPTDATVTTVVNTTSQVSGTVDGLAVQGPSASDELIIIQVAFSKAFAGPGAATGSVELQFVIDNLSDTDPISGLAFLDNLDAVIPGLVASNTPLAGVCGSGSELTGSSVLSLTGGSVPAGESCMFSVLLDIPASAAAGSFTNTTSDLTSGGLFLAAPASANLGVQPPPGFGKVFAPNAIAIDGTSTLTFTIDNTGSTLAADSLDFTDNLPAGLAVAATPNASSTCGGTVTAAPGAGSLSFTGGTVAAGAACTVQVDITGTAEGTFDNVSGALTSSSGDSGTAGDTIDVVAGDFVVTKSFRTAPVLPGGLVELELSVVNGSDFPLTDVALTDDLAAVITGLVAEGLPMPDVCGAGSQVSGTGTVTLTGGNLPASGSCTIVVPVRVPADASAGTFTNTTSVATGTRESVAVEAPADSADLIVQGPAFTKTLTPDLAAAGSTTTATFTIVNPDPANSIDSLAFSDDLEAFLTGTTATNTPINDACGSGSLVDGASTLTLANGIVSAGGSCTVNVTLSILADASPGEFTNTTSELTGQVDGFGISVDAASAVLSVEPPPAFSKAFDPDTVLLDESSTLTFTIDNGASGLDAQSLAFTDNLPAGISVADPASAATTCTGGTLTATAGSSTIEYTGGSVEAGSSCTITVEVTATASGALVNTSGDLTSSSGNSGSASATLTVRAAPLFEKTFSPDDILAGETSTLTFTIDNSAESVSADNLAFIDNLPAGLEVAGAPNADNDCGGTLAAAAGSGQISLTGGSVGAGATCIVSVDITGAVEGTFNNVTEPLLSSLGNSGTASDSIDVVAGNFEITKSFRTQPVLPGGLVEMELSVANGSDFALTDIALTDDLGAALAGLVAEGLPMTGVCGTGSQVSGTGIVNLTGGNLTAGDSCTLVVPVRVPAEAFAGTFTNTTSVATALREGVAIESLPASADLIVEPLTFTKTFDPSIVAAGSTTTASFEIVNPDPANALSGLAFSDDLDAFVPGMTAGNTPISDACGTGSLVDGSAVIALSDGAVAAGGSCMFQVTLNVPAGTPAGEFTNTTSVLSSTVGGAQTSAAAASGVIDVQPPPAFSKTFSPDVILPGGITSLTFIIDNSSSQLEADSLAFEDNLPVGVEVAGFPALDNGCGGTLIADAGTGLISLSNGLIAAGGSCQIQVNVTAGFIDTFTNVTDDLTSRLGNSGDATATLTVAKAIPVPLLDNRWLALLTVLLAALAWNALDINSRSGLRPPRKEP